MSAGVRSSPFRSSGLQQKLDKLKSFNFMIDKSNFVTPFYTPRAVTPPLTSSSAADADSSTSNNSTSPPGYDLNGHSETIKIPLITRETLITKSGTQQMPEQVEIAAAKKREKARYATNTMDSYGLGNEISHFVEKAAYLDKFERNASPYILKEGRNKERDTQGITIDYGAGSTYKMSWTEMMLRRKAQRDTRASVDRESHRRHKDRKPTKDIFNDSSAMQQNLVSDDEIKIDIDINGPSAPLRIGDHDSQYKSTYNRESQNDRTMSATMRGENEDYVLTHETPNEFVFRRKKEMSTMSYPQPVTERELESKLRGSHRVTSPEDKFIDQFASSLAKALTLGTKEAVSHQEYLSKPKPYSGDHSQSGELKMTLQREWKRKRARALENFKKERENILRSWVGTTGKCFLRDLNQDYKKFLDTLYAELEGGLKNIGTDYQLFTTRINSKQRDRDEAFTDELDQFWTKEREKLNQEWEEQNLACLKDLEIESDRFQEDVLASRITEYRTALEEHWKTTLDNVMNSWIEDKADFETKVRENLTTETLKKAATLGKEKNILLKAWQQELGSFNKEFLGKVESIRKMINEDFAHAKLSMEEDIKRKSNVEDKSLAYGKTLMKGLTVSNKKERDVSPAGSEDSNLISESSLERWDDRAWLLEKMEREKERVDATRRRDSVIRDYMRGIQDLQTKYPNLQKYLVEAETLLTNERDKLQREKEVDDEEAFKFCSYGVGTNLLGVSARQSNKKPTGIISQKVKAQSGAVKTNDATGKLKMVAAADAFEMIRQLPSTLTTAVSDISTETFSLVSRGETTSPQTASASNGDETSSLSSSIDTEVGHPERRNDKTMTMSKNNLLLTTKNEQTINVPCSSITPHRSQSYRKLPSIAKSNMITHNAEGGGLLVTVIPPMKSVSFIKGDLAPSGGQVSITKPNIDEKSNNASKGPDGNVLSSLESISGGEETHAKTDSKLIGEVKQKDASKIKTATNGALNESTPEPSLPSIFGSNNKNGTSNKLLESSGRML